MISPSRATRPGEGSGDDLEPEAPRARRRRRDRRPRWGRPSAGSGIASRPGADEAGEIVDMAVGMVVHQAAAEPEHAVDAEIRAQPRLDLGRASRPGLRLGLSRHCSVVTARPVPSTSIAPPSRIQSARRTSEAGRLGRAAAPIAVVAGQVVFAAPAVEAEARSPRGAAGPFDDDRPGVAQPDVAERLRRPRSAKGASARAAAAEAASAATSRTSSPLPSGLDRRGEGGDLAPAPGSRSSSHSSAWLGKPIQTKACGAHSGGWRRVIAHCPARRAVADGAEFVAGEPVRPVAARRELAADR